MILKKVPEALLLEGLLEPQESPLEGLDDVAFVGETQPGTTINVAFTEPLLPGLYVLFGYSPYSTGDAGVQAPADGIMAEFTVR